MRRRSSRTKAQGSSCVMENVDQDQQNNEVIRQAQFAGTQENNNQVQVRDKISPISCKAKISYGAPPTISLDQAEKKMKDEIVMIEEKI